MSIQQSAGGPRPLLVRSAVALQRAIAQSTLATDVAVKVRNFCTQVIAHRVHTTIAMEENGEAWLLREIGRDVHRFVDVGANVGDWSATLLEVAPAARGLLVEPSLDAGARLASRFRDDARVKLIAAAAGREAGEADFFEEADAGLTSSLLAHATRGPTQRRRVRVRTLDELLATEGWPSVDVVKTDCEGFDQFVLFGAAEAIRARRIGVIQFEYNDCWRDAGASLATTASFLKDAGYSLYLLRNSGLHRDWEKFGEFYLYSNFVALNPAWSGGERLVRGRI